MIKNKTQEFTLPNGLRVVLLQDKTTPLSVVSVLYNVGSRNENPNLTGIAHLMEHLMFEGSESVPDFDTTFQNLGGDSNAYTNSDVTHYFNTLPAQNLEYALWIEGDRMQNLNINQESLDKQKKIVLEEYHETVFNETYGDMWHKILPEIYSDHPYQWPTIGKSLEAIKSISLQDIQDFYDLYYQPSNAVVVIGSPKPFDEVKQYVEKYFSPIANNTITRPSYEYNHLDSIKTFIKGKANTPRSAFYMAFPMASRFDPNFYHCDIISDILAHGDSSRLYRRLVNDLELLTDVQCFVNATLGPGLLIIEGRLSPKVPHEKAEEEIWKILEDLKNDPIKINELIKTKNKIVTERAFTESNILNKTLNVGLFKAWDKLDYYFTEPKLYNDICIEDIQGAAKALFSREKYVCLRYTPSKERVSS